MPQPPVDGPDPRDPYSRLQYRRLFAWPTRIRREAPFLEAVASRGPEPTLLDLGCGTGEHAQHFAAQGYRVVGVDRSEAQIAAARESAPAGAKFVVGDLTALGESVHERFGTAVCLGNTLVHIQDTDTLRTVCRNVFAALLPGGWWLTQILNYAGIFARGERALPVNVREDQGETLVFVRVLLPHADGRVSFFPSTLRLRPDADPPLELLSSRRVEHRGWTHSEIEAELVDAGFDTIEWYGDMTGGTFDAQRSNDLVFLAHHP
jgi:glycine/sarcosine N-methyltransferase